MFGEISLNSQENTCARVSINFIKKETLSQVFSCEFCEVFKNTFFYWTPLVAAFVHIFLKFIFPKIRTFPKIWITKTCNFNLVLLKNVFFIEKKSLEQLQTDSYKPCTHPHPPTLTHIHPHPAKKRSHSPTPTRTQPEKGHTYSAQKRSHSPTPTRTQPEKSHTYPAQKRSNSPTPTCTQSKKSHTDLQPPTPS